MKKLLLTLIAVAFLAALSALFWFTQIYPNTPSQTVTEIELKIERGSSGKQIAQNLASNQLVLHPHLFQIYATISGKASKFQAGEYAFAPAITPDQIIHKLSKGDIILRQVTIPEGKTVAEIIDILNAAPELQGEVEIQPKEGTLLPNTYRFTKGETRQSIINRMVESHEDLMESLWPTRQQRLPFSTPFQAVTLASIVEKETGLPQERNHVAGLYINRLHQGMLLQADPTVSYGIHGGQSGVRALTYRDLKRPNPYNTYLNTGLPPGPICNPGKESIMAVLNPKKTNDLFMVATGTGGHYFAQTNAQHSQNVERYRAWQKQQAAGKLKRD